MNDDRVDHDNNANDDSGADGDHDLTDDAMNERVDSAVRVLARRTPAGAGWRPADAVRATVRNRRRRRTLGSGVMVVLAVAGAVTLTVGGTDDPPRTTARPLAVDARVHVQARLDGSVQLVADRVPLVGKDSGATKDVVSAEQALSIKLLQHLPANINSSVSPLSLYFALGMLQNAARGTTRDEISHALQASGISTTNQNAGLSDLTATLARAAAKDGLIMQAANSLWAQRGFTVKGQFLATLASYYRTGVWQTDFTTPEAKRAIDAWTSQQTHGKITKLFDQLDPSTVLVLANAVFFKAGWAVPFDPGSTEPGTFTRTDGTSTTAQFMSGRPGASTAVTADYQAVQLPYRGGRFAALAVMPRHGSLDDFVAGLTPSTLAGIGGRLAADQRVIVAVPRFTTTSMIDMKPVLTDLGMRRAFTGSADFSGLSATPTQVDQVIQRVYVSVGEKGTTAAAVTGVAIAASSTEVPKRIVRFDRPFLFLVRDTTTGAILFASRITDPSAN